MAKVPPALKTVATTVAVLIAGLLLAGILTVAYRNTRPPEGYDQPRVHLNTKNSTRFAGDDLAEVSTRVSQAVFPGGEGAAPDVVLLYDPEDWQGGLMLTPLLRPLNGVLLPATGAAADEIGRLSPAGSEALDGAAVVLEDGTTAPEDTPDAGQPIDAAGVVEALRAAGQPPQHAIIVPDDPEVALLAGPWAAYSGDLIVFDAADAPDGVPLFALGDAPAPDGTPRITGRTPAHIAVAFAAYDNPDFPLFGWGFNADSLTGYRAYTLANRTDPGMALLSANFSVRGKPGPLLWSEVKVLPPVVSDYLWSQRAAWWVTPSEGPFHHFWVLGSEEAISFPAQSQADYAVEIGPYLGKGIGMSGIDLLAAIWVALGIASALWIAYHEVKFLAGQNWVMRLAWPLFALMMGPFGIVLYKLAHNRPILTHEGKVMWDRPLWMQGMVATVSAIGFGASLMIASGFVSTLFGLPLFPNQDPFFFLGTPMILVMIINYVVAVLISWPVFQTPMLAGFYGESYSAALPHALPMVLISMTAAALGMNPAMWWLMMSHIPMMPSEEQILWFGVMFFTAFAAFLVAWPFNYLLVRAQRKSGLM